MKLTRLLPDSINSYVREGDPSPVHYECRRCGKTLTATHVTCPTCGSCDVASIAL